MKYRYAYKTSDGSRHESSIDAESREAVFSALRKQGIRPIKVIASDGTKANGELRGIRKRAVIPLVLGAAAVGALITLLSGEKKASETPSIFTDQTRKQVIGDLAIIEKGIRTGWADVFDNEGDRFLASFAIPGMKAGQRNTTVEEIERALREAITIEDGDTLEIKQIKSMVEGMKAEAREYLSAGGTIVEYGERLTERQDSEIRIFQRTKAELESARKNLDEIAFDALYNQRNSELRNLGIQPVILSD